MEEKNTLISKIFDLRIYKKTVKQVQVEHPTIPCAIELYIITGEIY